MNAQEQLNYQEGINDFANAHAATVATVTGLQQQNATLQELLPVMQQQINAMCTQMANMHMANATNTTPPPNYQNFGYQGRGGRGGGRGGKG